MNLNPIRTNAETNNDKDKDKDNDKGNDKKNKKNDGKNIYSNSKELGIRKSTESLKSYSTIQSFRDKYLSKTRRNKEVKNEGSSSERAIDDDLESNQGSTGNKNTIKGSRGGRPDSFEMKETRTN
jgi:hypothetical protein